MPQYKIVYFDARGRAEIIRQVFILAGQEFEDCRLKEGEWANFKPDAPFGQAPILQVDGKTVLGQSLAIARYLARKFGLAGKDEMEQARVDMIVDCTEDVMKIMMALYMAKDEAVKEEIRKKFTEEQGPENLKKFESLLSKSTSGYFVGDSITWCDLHFVAFLDVPEALGAAVPLDKYPNVLALKSKVESNPKIAAWMAKRPQTKF